MESSWQRTSRGRLCARPFLLTCLRIGTEDCRRLMSRKMITNHAKITSHQFWLLLPGTEAAQYQIQDVIRCGLTGDGVERAQSTVKVEHNHFMRDFALDRQACGIEVGDGFLHQT